MKEIKKGSRKKILRLVSELEIKIKNIESKNSLN